MRNGQIISVSGIKRSASTVQYNLIRIALELAGWKVNICGHNYAVREVPDGEVDLVKRHKFSKVIAENAGHIFLTDRPSEGIRQSLQRFNGNNPSKARIEDMKKHLTKWSAYSEHFMYDYYLWKQNPELYTNRMIRDLDLGVHYSGVLEEFRKIKPPKTGQDPHTLLFHNHITK